MTRSRRPPPVRGEFLRVVPDLVVDVLSASTGSRDRVEKKAIYERNGLCEYWLVDSLAREITVFVLEGGTSRYGVGRVYQDGERARSAILRRIGGGRQRSGRLSRGGRTLGNMTKWAYRRVQYDILEVSEDSFEQKLNKHGDEGWELVSSFDRERGGNSKECFFIFKKPKD